MKQLRCSVCEEATKKTFSGNYDITSGTSGMISRRPKYFLSRLLKKSKLQFDILL